MLGRQAGINHAERKKSRIEREYHYQPVYQIARREKREYTPYKTHITGVTPPRIPHTIIIIMAEQLNSNFIPERTQS